MKDVLEHIVRGLVENPDAVEVVEEAEEGAVRLRVTVAPDDMGKVIGRRGRTARAIRDVVRAAATRAGLDASVEIAG